MSALNDWFDLMSCILYGAIKVVNTMLESKSVLIHCSDGWDRTSQLISLA
jgi:hypothetical protein